MHIAISEVHLKGRAERKKDEETNNKLIYEKTHFLNKELKR